MLISLSRKFIFVANLKSASTAIEAALRPFSQISLVEARFGKHLPYRIIEQRFGWIFDYVGREDFFVFGVMREPIDFVISLYNSHADEKFKNFPQLYTGGMDFEAFITIWERKNRDQLRPQFHRFLTGKGYLGANYIISHANLLGGLKHVADTLRVPALRELPRSNVSERRFQRQSLTHSQMGWIADHFRRDYEFMDEFCDRRLADADRNQRVLLRSGEL